MHDDPLEHRHPDHPHDVDVAQVPRSPHTPGQTNTPSLNRPMAHMITLRFLTIVMIMLAMLEIIDQDIQKEKPIMIILYNFFIQCQ